MAAGTLFATNTFAQSAGDIRGPSPLIAIENEAPGKLVVDPPLPEPLTRDLVFVQYRTESLRVMPVFGTGALDVSPRLGHIHIAVDDGRANVVSRFDQRRPRTRLDAARSTLCIDGSRSTVHTSGTSLTVPEKVCSTAICSMMLPLAMVTS
jgi:hypothetical protein